MSDREDTLESRSLLSTGIAVAILEEGPSATVFLAADRLQVDRGNYQRDQDRQKMSDMARRWNPRAVGVILVNRRLDGSFWVMDGAHRIGAAIQRFGARHPLKCELYEGLSIAEEADVFWLVNSKRGLVPTLKRYRAAFMAKDPEVVEIASLLGEMGLGYSFVAGKDRELICWAAVHDVYRRGGRTHLAEVLKLIDGAWAAERLSLEGWFVKGVSLLIRHHSKDEAWSLDEAIRRLSSVPAAVVVKDAKETRSNRSQRKLSPPSAMYESLHWFYNKQRRTRKLSGIKAR